MTKDRPTEKDQADLKTHREKIQRRIPRDRLQQEWDDAKNTLETARVRLQTVMDRIRLLSSPQDAGFGEGDAVEEIIFNRRGTVQKIVGFGTQDDRVGAYYEVSFDQHPKAVIHENLLRAARKTLGEAKISVSEI